MLKLASRVENPQESFQIDSLIKLRKGWLRLAKRHKQQTPNPNNILKLAIDSTKAPTLQVQRHATPTSRKADVEHVLTSVLLSLSSPLHQHLSYAKSSNICGCHIVTSTDVQGISTFREVVVVRLCSTSSPQLMQQVRNPLAVCRRYTDCTSFETQACSSLCIRCCICEQLELRAGQYTTE
jgi:hypothetical protein